MTAAKAAGQQVLISFEHTRDSAAYCYLPTRPQYRAAVRAFRDTFPYVSLYTSWNEPNHPSQPTNTRFDKDHGKANQAEADASVGFRQVGRFWTDLKKDCQRSKIPRAMYSTFKQKVSTAP